MMTEDGKRWVEALRSGKYEQARGKLRRESRDELDQLTGECCYCCLGVAADILDPNGWQKDKSHVLSRIHDEDNEPMDFLNDEALERLGLTHNAQMMLASLNDRKRWSFAQIAEVIENDLDRYMADGKDPVSYE